MVTKASLVTKLWVLWKKICQAGHTVVFDCEGEVNRLREEDGNYMLDAW